MHEEYLTHPSFCEWTRYDGCNTKKNALTRHRKGNRHIAATKAENTCTKESSNKTHTKVETFVPHMEDLAEPLDTAFYG